MARPKLRIVSAKPVQGWIVRSEKRVGDLILGNALKPVVVVKDAGS